MPKTIEERVTQLESQVRHTRILCGAAIAVLVALIAGGAVRGAKDEDLICHSLSVVDGSGRVGVFITAMDQGKTTASAIHINDRDEKARIALRVYDNGDPSAGIVSKDGNTLAALAVGFNGSGEVRLFNKLGKPIRR